MCRYLIKYDISANWEMPKVCNFRCEYCFYKGDPKASPHRGHENIDEIINGFNGSGLVWLIHMSGGEPFLDTHFVELCKGLKNHFISINTNLSTSNVNDFVEQVNPERVAFIHCSLHIDERERLKLVQDFIDKYHSLKERGFNTYVTQVMYPPLLRRFDEIFDHFKEYGIAIRPKVFRGRYKQKIYPLSYREGERKKILKYSGLSEELDKLSFDTDIDPRLDWNFIRGTLSFKGLLCKAGKDFVTIEYNGNIIRCPGEPISLGDIISGRLLLHKESKPCVSETCLCPYHGLKFAEGKYRLVKNNSTMDALKCFAKEAIRQIM